MAKKNMPDVSQTSKNTVYAAINWVGMANIELPVQVKNCDGVIDTLARVQTYVSLDNHESKGIHMSRLYLILQQYLSNQLLTPALLKSLCQRFLESHESLSKNAKLEIKFDYYEKRKSLISDNQGWKKYPIRLAITQMDGDISIELGCEVIYSSTCPCSSALSRQLLQENFEQTFSDLIESAQAVPTDKVVAWLTSEETSFPTPHSQRSAAVVKLKLHNDAEMFDISSILSSLEDTLGTPVQAAVKREDEQEFARLNGENLMFCEDASRKLYHLLESQDYADFWLRVDHFESLHPHDAVAIKVKGVVGGYQPDLK